MPSLQVLTKRRVKRRQQRFVSKNAKRKVRSVRKHRKTAKKVMRGGGTMYETKPSYAFVLYDNIPQQYIGGFISNDYIRVPICIILIAPNMIGKDDIYLFFNKKITGADVKIFVKLLLGISDTDEFTLKPDIDLTSNSAVVSEATKTTEDNELWSALGNTLVKLTGCGFNSYCIETYSFSETGINKSTRVQHEITTNNQSYKLMNGEKIKTYLDRANFFTRSVVNSNAVLPDLHKKYFVLATGEKEALEDDEVTNEMFTEYFGEDIESSDPYFKIDKVLKKLCEQDTSLTFDTLLANFKKNKMDDYTLFRKLEEANGKILDRRENVKNGSSIALNDNQADQFLDLWRNEEKQLPKISKPVCGAKAEYGRCVWKTYDDFKKAIRHSIARNIIGIKNHMYYGLRVSDVRQRVSDEVNNILNGKRPLKITKAIQLGDYKIDIKSNRDIISKGMFKDVISKINMDSARNMTSIVNVNEEDHPFTKLHEEWWIEKENEYERWLKKSIQDQKIDRVVN
jgi:hypothetical protein